MGRADAIELAGMLEKWGPIAAADPEGGSGPFHFQRADKELKAPPALEGSARAAPGHSTSEMIQEDRKNIDPEQVRKLAGWGLTENDIASFVGWSQSLISLGF